MQGPKRYKAITGRPQPRGCALVCAGLFMHNQLQSPTLAAPLAGAAASGRLPPGARGVKILRAFLSKPSPPAVKV